METANDCILGVDIVTTVTADKTWATILTEDMIEPGMHINAIGGDCPGKTELDINVLKVGKIFVEHEPQSRTEGNIQQPPLNIGSILYGASLPDWMLAESLPNKSQSLIQ